MKINVFLFLIAIMLSVIFTYLIYVLCNENYENVVLLCICSFITLLSALMFVMGVSHNNAKQNLNIKVLSTVFALIFLILNIIFSFLYVGINAIIIGNFFLFIVFILLLYLLGRTTV